MMNKENRLIYFRVEILTQKKQTSCYLPVPVHMGVIFEEIKKIGVRKLKFVLACT